MLKVYGSKMCPDCIECKANLDYYHIEYEYLDINESLKTLKEFLIYRDTYPVFDHLKEIHDIGLPTLIGEDNIPFTDWETYLKDKGFEPIKMNNGSSCSITGKGC